MSQEPSTNSFDWIAPVYDGLARLVYGKAQKQAQAHFLASVAKGVTVLIVGGGTGWVLTELLRVAKPSQILFLEASAKMLQQAELRFQKAPRPDLCNVAFRWGTEADLLPEEKFHVVLTPFVLDLFSMPQARQMMQKLDAHLLHNGLWLHTDFDESQAPLRRLWQKPLLWAMYRFFGWASHISGKKLPAFRKLFKELRLTLEDEAFYYKGFICAQKYRKKAA